ncbi:MAG: VIT1/CCC1 transporter family protein [Acidimicrobiales bacterium]|jgi:VIT1/CCC1 family predicted Fe2+/Mn2+ transporter|nr:VIT1/CCC1 transporter family protein [Acidimicrobiales bacterium]MDP7118164.1 VIT1/CCC1 transporter family protein [Acidimicrobiales bacterium]MEE1521741.1 VIT1/CCC1 transporter family protein [Acidimicrobiales bacterium]MEE1569986.1 VIT1/CCC1 transporter family protein [Acidimicrobiales bacterium]HJM26876.1 VIT1/CCC1 transporter family protein [Acidimicrobiales bacterium]|tara:strand:+ start:10037 stop:10741 length:705 start_codon:yes stop_codon:yes gene_type:complete
MDKPEVHRHRDVQGGTARAAVFGVSDGLVSNVALILGIAGASTDPAFVRVAGVSGLLAGAVSMAAGEYISLKAQAELLERELAIERDSIAEDPELETAELTALFVERGLDVEYAERVARDLMSDPEVALEIHAREELGVDPHNLGSPMQAAVSSFLAFVLGAFVPLVPWLGGGGTGAVWASAILGVAAAAVVGALLARLTERSMLRTVVRQVLVAAGACSATYLIGGLLGASVT